MVVLYHQYTEKHILFLHFSAGGLYDWGILLIISLEFQGKSINRFLWHSLLKNSKTITNNVPAIEPANGKRLHCCRRVELSFHHAAEIEQPHSMTGLLKRPLPKTCQGTPVSSVFPAFRGCYAELAPVHSILWCAFPLREAPVHSGLYI